jgi:hypothetical protein
LFSNSGRERTFVLVKYFLPFIVKYDQNIEPPHNKGPVFPFFDSWNQGHAGAAEGFFTSGLFVRSPCQLWWFSLDIGTHTVPHRTTACPVA